MRYIRIEFTDVPAGEYANLAELRLYGIRNETEGYETGETYISDVEWGDDLPDGVYMDSSAGQKKINLNGYEYDKGFGVKTNSEVVFDLEKHAPRYCRFKCRAGIDEQSDLQGEVKICAYEDEQLVYEKTLTGKEAFADIDLSVNKVKTLKLTATSNTPGVCMDWADAKLTGVIRNISLEGKDLTAESFINMDTLVSGGELCINTGIKNKLESGRQLAGAVNLYAADGSLLRCKMASADVPGNTKTEMKLAIDIPADIADGAYAVFAVWDRNTLIPLTETITISYSGEAAGNGKAGVDTARDESQLKQAIKSAMDIIYPGDAERYTLQSRAGFTDKLLNASGVLGNRELGQSDVDLAANEMNEAIKNLKYVQTDPEPDGNANEQQPPKGGAGEQPPLPVNTNIQPPVEKKRVNAVPQKGSIHKIGKLKYKILVSSATKGTVTVYRAQSKSLRKVIIPAKVKINGYSFKVTEISDRAFYANKKLEKVILGKNIRKIGKKAFYGSSRLKNADIKSKSLARVGAKAFAKTHKKLTIKVPKSKKKAYKQKLAL